MLIWMAAGQCVFLVLFFRLYQFADTKLCFHASIYTNTMNRNSEKIVNEYGCLHLLSLVGAEALVYLHYHLKKC